MSHYVLQKKIFDTLTSGQENKIYLHMPPPPPPPNFKYRQMYRICLFLSRVPGGGGGGESEIYKVEKMTVRELKHNAILITKNVTIP